ncbi:MAG: zinc ribbon domain-containing protein [Myxococcota bacterium]|nr:zinc ribbon domain-containing protein [Myxococcota bacterium]
MPLYEYICKECGHEFDVLQSFSAEPIRICEKCGAEEVVKKISVPSFALKGEGWYKDHYGLKSSTGGSDSSSTGSESKSESKAEKPSPPSKE